MSLFCLNLVSARQISSKTCLGKSTVARVIKELLPEKENVKLGHPSKLSSLDKRRIFSSITTRKIDNAVQATHLINPVLASPISAQTAHNVLKAVSLKAMVKKKKPLLLVKYMDFAFKYKNWTVED